MTEAELVKRAKRGDVDAFAKLYEQIYIRLYQFALYTLGNSHDAEDAVSETVTDCFEQIKSLRHDEAFSAWMFRVLSNKCNRRMRGYYQARQELSLSDFSEEELRFTDTGWRSNELGPSNSFDSSNVSSLSENIPSGMMQNQQDLDAAIDVRDAFFRLDDEERMILSMQIFLGYRPGEIAALLNLKEGTVRSKKSRALEKMRKMLENSSL